MTRDIIVILLVTTGMCFLAVGALGLRRFPDTLSRLHVVGLIDTLGTPLILIGASVHLGFTLATAKLVLASVFLYATSPLIGHMLGRIELKNRRDTGGNFALGESAALDAREASGEDANS